MTSVILIWCCFHLLSTITIYVRANPVHVNSPDIALLSQENHTHVNALGTHNRARGSETDKSNHEKIIAETPFFPDIFVDDSENLNDDHQSRDSNRLLLFEDTTANENRNLIDGKHLANVDKLREPQADVIHPENAGFNEVTPRDLEIAATVMRRCPDADVDEDAAVDEDDAASEKRRRMKRAARHIYATTWPRGVIPFQFQWGMEAWQKHMVRRVMAVWESRTCVRFREWPMAYDR